MISADVILGPLRGTAVRSGRARLCEEGSLGEYDAFFVATWPRTVSFLCVILRDRQEAEDVAQEAYMRASRHWDRIAGYESPEGWVRRVALNLALSARHRRGRWKDWLARHGSMVAARVDGHSTTGVPALTEGSLDLQRALAQLPMRYRVVLTLHYLCDLPVSQVAADLGLPEPTVRAQLVRGRRLLAQHLRPEPAEEPTREGPHPGPDATSPGTWAVQP